MTFSFIFPSGHLKCEIENEIIVKLDLINEMQQHVKLYVINLMQIN